jgi:ABC-type uncharacterized transport system substrate-binding protein
MSDDRTKADKAWEARQEAARYRIFNVATNAAEATDEADDENYFAVPATRALKQTTATIPIVFALLIDPVASGVVSDLARPNGNVTGFMNFESGMGGKWLELLKQLSPNIKTIALIFNPHTTPYQGILQSIKVAAPGFGIEITASGVDDTNHLRDTIVAAGRVPGTAVVVFPDIFTTAHRDQIVALIAQARLPAIYPYRYFTAAGGLMS